MLRIVASLSYLLLIIDVSFAEKIPIQPNYVKQSACGFASCSNVDPKKLNIHLVPHTHNDVGWLKTVDQYYYGNRPTIQKAGVKTILDDVIEALRHNPSRRFIYVETAFLWKWWQQQNEKTRSRVKKYIDDGRLEIIGGGWTMNDEAVTHYQSTIDQFSWGFRRLNDTFGECARPRVGWQIDPFGHSKEQAALFHRMGFDGMFFGRLDFQDKAKRLSDKTAEFIWQASPLSYDVNRENLFSVVLFNNYSPPPGFCFDILCDDEPIIDDPDSPENNINARVTSFIEYSRNQSLHYQSNNIILTMGGDFTYQQAELWFNNLDKLIRHINERNGSEINVFYSTPSCYLKSLHDVNTTWPTKSDDFFPYASDPHAYWTGYYSSRPTLKFYERMGNHLLQVAKQLSVLTNLRTNDAKLDYFREAMGVMQHHDAITGTEKQHVADDYARILYEGMNHGADIVSEALGKWTIKDNTSKPSDWAKFHSCMLLNISSCTHSEENRNFVVTLYNPTYQWANVRIPVCGNAYSVRDPGGKEMVTQLVPIPDAIRRMPGRKSKATKELVFLADYLPQNGYESFYVSEKPDTAHENKTAEGKPISSIGFESVHVTINEAGNVVIQWTDEYHMNINVVQSFHYYESAEGNNKAFENRSSGAYIFRPNDPVAKDVKNVGSYQFYKGAVVQELQQTINEWLSQVVRVYPGGRLEFIWMVGPIPTDSDKIGKEIITRYTSNLTSNGEFFTDSNSRQTIKRKRNFRPTWNLKLDEPIAGNYYPITSTIYLEDKQKKFYFGVLTDRAQGGSSLADGQLELMIHRRLLKDDAFGVGEALNETAYGEGLIARGTHNVFSNKLYESGGDIGLGSHLSSWTLFTPANDITFDQWRNKYNMWGAGLRNRLPYNVNILTLEPWKDNSVLIRLECVASGVSCPTADLSNLFVPFTITSVRETTLGGNQWLEDAKPLKWKAETNEVPEYSFDKINQPLRLNDSLTVQIDPMEIRTFIVTVSYTTAN